MLLVFALLATVVGGCATIKEIPFDTSKVSNLAGKEVIAVNRPVPDFLAVTRARMSVGFVPYVGFLMRNDVLRSAGNLLVQQNDIADPAYEIAEEIGHSLAIKYGTKYAGVGTAVVSDDDPGVVAAVYKSAPLLLDIKTINWGGIYFSVSSDRYRAFYLGRLRLIDANTSSVLAEGMCRSLPDRKDDDPSYDALIENSASRLKQQLKEAVRF